MSRPLEQRHALVTGGGRGIGRAIAAALTSAGATVTIMGRDRAALDGVVAAGEAARACVADVTDAGSVRDAVGQHSFDILIANAGAARSAPFAKSEPAMFREMLDVNLMGVVNAIQAVLGGMTERKFGRVVAVASTAGLKGYAYVSAYCAAKHAVVGLVRALAIETAKTGVTVNAVCPGFTDTDMAAQSIATIVAKTGRSPVQALTELTKQNPQGRLVTPQEVADAVLWLCGDAAAAITGQAIAVAGGEV